MTAISLTQARETAQAYLRYFDRGERMSMDMSCDDALQVCRAVLHLTKDSASALVGNDDANDPSARQDDEQPCSKDTRCWRSDGHQGACAPLSNRERTESGEARDTSLSLPNAQRVRDRLAVEGDSLVGTASRSNGRQVGGTHYGLRDYQHWDFVIEFDLDYFQGQITKYVMRWKKKNGVQDLEKAKHFLEKYIDEINAGTVSRG